MSTRNIVTDYHRGDELLKRTCAVHADRATCHALYHLQSDEYGATYAIVYDCERGIDLAVFTRSPTKIEILYKRKLPNGAG